MDSGDQVDKLLKKKKNRETQEKLAAEAAAAAATGGGGNEEESDDDEDDDALVRAAMQWENDEKVRERDAHARAHTRTHLHLSHPVFLQEKEDLAAAQAECLRLQRRASELKKDLSSTSSSGDREQKLQQLLEESQQTQHLAEKKVEWLTFEREDLRGVLEDRDRFDNLPKEQVANFHERPLLAIENDLRDQIEEAQVTFKVLVVGGGHGRAGGTGPGRPGRRAGSGIRPSPAGRRARRLGGDAGPGPALVRLDRPDLEPRARSRSLRRPSQKPPRSLRKAFAKPSQGLRKASQGLSKAFPRPS